MPSQAATLLSVTLEEMANGNRGCNFVQARFVSRSADRVRSWLLWVFYLLGDRSAGHANNSAIKARPVTLDAQDSRNMHRSGRRLNGLDVWAGRRRDTIKLWENEVLGVEVEVIFAWARRYGNDLTLSKQEQSTCYLIRVT